MLHDPPLEDRHARLLQLIDDLGTGRMTLKHPTGLNVLYLYYDLDADGNLEILDDAHVRPENKEFAMVIRDCAVNITPPATTVNNKYMLVD